MPSSQVSTEADREKAYESEAQETGSTDLNTRSKGDKGVQVNFADENEAQQTGSTGVNTTSKLDKAVQVSFCDEKENHRSRQNMDKKCGQGASSAGVNTKTKYQEALQINFAAEKDQQGLTIVTFDKNKHKSVNGCQVMKSEYEEALEPGVSETEDKDTDGNVEDFNGGVALVSLFHVKRSNANKNKDDEAVIGEGIRGEFQQSVQEKDGEHSSEVHANEIQEAVGSEFQTNVQAEEENCKRNYASETGMNVGKKAVQHEYLKDVQRGNYTDRAEINEKVAEEHESHTNVTDINSGKEAIEREYHEGVPADISEDDQGGNCKSRACINEGKEVAENVHHEGVEMDVADDGGYDQRENFMNEGDKNEGLEAVESVYYVAVQADLAEEHQARNDISEAIMNEGKEAVESEDDVPADATEEGQPGKSTSETERNEVQNAVEIEFYEAVYVEVAEVVLDQGGNYTGEAGINVETEFYEDVKYVAEGSDRNQDQKVVVTEFHEVMQVDGEECDKGNYTSESYTNEDQQFVREDEAVESTFPETIQGSVLYEREDQREIQTHESDTNKIGNLSVVMEL